jgi:thioredoxin reductase
MESAQESIRMGMVHRAVTFGLAVLATSLIFTSVPVVFTAGAGEAQPARQLASAAGEAAIAHPGA